ncbi:putative membrane protein [Desulfobotulus alkaliphilus]|uniref:Putative membrane protein n=1 Tax=Desulfobotulus alkaliphilus TaxID=622671 RepID=A0A562S0D3_9BACT|nr:DsbA family protein [Desulfobotulus alkaliphilus]TWI73950.1 putative membrane protein [Desulfobotulus alkaliphilus]
MIKKIFHLLLATALFFSAWIAANDLFSMPFLSPSAVTGCETACTSLHESSIGILYGIPLSLLGFLGLLVFWILRIRGFEKISFWIISAMAGAELYLILLQFFYFREFCTSCLIFAAMVFMIYIVTLVQDFFLKPPARLRELPAKCFPAFVFMLVFHMVLFPPFFPERILAEGLPICLTEKKTGKDLLRIEVFVSPDCPFCEAAVSYFSGVLYENNLKVSIRIKHVGLNAQSRRRAVENVAMGIYGDLSPAALKMAECYILQNEKELADIQGSPLQTPMIRLVRDGDIRHFTGWTARNQEQIAEIIKELIPDRGRPAATADWFHNRLPSGDTVLCPSTGDPSDRGVCGF